MSLWDSIREATPPFLGGTGGALTEHHKQELSQAASDEIAAVAIRADEYYGSASDTAAVAHAAATANEKLSMGDVEAVAAINDKANSECSLLSVIDGQAQFSVCYPHAKWLIGGVLVLIVLAVLSPYLKLVKGR